MVKRFTKKIVKKKTYKISPKEAETIINDEFMTPKGYKIRKKFIFKPENPNNSGIKIYFNHEVENE